MSDEPSGSNGRETDTVDTVPDGCRCGAGPHPEKDDRCARGHVLPGNLTAAVVGQRGLQFWEQHDGLYGSLCEEVAADLGHGDFESAPAATRAAIGGLVQAVIVRDAAYHRVLEDGGPLSSAGRTRRAANVQKEWDRRAEGWARLLGLARVPRPARTLEEVMSGGD